MPRLPMQALATLPGEIRASYLRMSPPARHKFEARLRAMQILTSTPRARWEATAVVLSSRIQVELRVALGVPRVPGCSAKRLLDLFREFRREGASALIERYGEGEQKPEAFIQFLCARAEKNKRASEIELEAIRTEWLSGKDIPGYGTWQATWSSQFPDEAMPAHCPDWFIPSGWSIRNLRRYLPGEAALTLARKGYFAAHGSLPQLRQDYSALRPLEYVVFDDVRMDFLVSYPGINRACEMWLLVAMDAATRMVLDWVSLAAVPDDEGKRAELLEEHMLILAGGILQRYGIPSGYKMTLVVENQKATLRDAAKNALAAISGGQIDIEHTRMVNRSLASGYTERHGTPYGLKAILESSFKTFHNHSAALPGNTGPTYDLAPAELKAMKAEHKALMEEAAELPAEVAQQLRSPFLKYSEEAVPAVERLFNFLNSRRKHGLQGFTKYEVWRFPEDTTWRSIEELRRYPAADIGRAIIDWRYESPRERFTHLSTTVAPFVRVPEEALIPFMARTIAKVRHPAPYTIAWTEQGTKFVYRGEIGALATGDGGPFMVKLLPGNLTVAFLYDATGGNYLGKLTRATDARIGDKESTDRAVGEVQHYRSLIEKPIRERHADERTANEQRTRLNEAIIKAHRTGQTMTSAATETARTTKAEATAARKKRMSANAALAEAARANLANQEI